MLVLRSGPHESDPRFAEEAAECLDDCVAQQSPHDEARRPPHAHYLTALLKAVGRHADHIGLDRAAMIEWRYYSALRHARDFEAPNLSKRLAESPYFFATMVALAFRPAAQPEGARPPLSDAERTAGRHAFALLYDWKTPPGLDHEGRIDPEVLQAWICDARQLLIENDRLDVGYDRIGAVLASSPADPDGSWPGLAVRELIEREKSDCVEVGFVTAVLNSRGATSRSPTEGGAPERSLAEQHADKKRNFEQWPRTAAIFSRLSSSYKNMAAVNDR